MVSGGEAAHVGTDLTDDALGGGLVHSGDRVQKLYRHGERERGIRFAFGSGLGGGVRGGIPKAGGSLGAGIEGWR